MRMTQEGLDLIKSFEGFSATWYKCPAGIWTIGYGHTEAAGPPKYEPQRKISRDEGENILRSDLAKYEQAVIDAVTVKLTDEQYSALVSFCYNVGPNAFRKSSVLKAVNSGRHDLVPARLALFTKGGGKVLKGLVRRRQAEGELYASGDDDARIYPSTEVTPVIGKASYASSTNIAAGVGTVAMTTAAVNQITNDVSDTAMTFGFSPQWVMVGILAIGIAAALWIMRERILKSKTEGV